MILASRKWYKFLCGYSRGFIREGASNDSAVVDDDIFGYFGGYFFGNFRERRHCLQTKTNKKAVLWQGNRVVLVPLSKSIRRPIEIYSGIARFSLRHSCSVKQQATITDGHLRNFFFFGGGRVPEAPAGMTPPHGSH